MEKIQAEIAIDFMDDKSATHIFNSIQPETVKSFSDRSAVSIQQEGTRICLKINAKDLTAFRATVNSYLIWTRMLLSILEVCQT